MASSSDMSSMPPNCSMEEVRWSNLSGVARSNLETISFSGIFSPRALSLVTMLENLPVKSPTDYSFPMKM